MTKKQRVLEWIKREPITQIQATHSIRTTRLAALIKELRDEGWNIRTEDVTEGRTTYARYHLIKD